MDIPSQITSKITQSSNVLVIVAGNNGDSLSAGLALQSFLKKLEKESELLSFTPKLGVLNFLSGYAAVREQLEIVKNFVIDVSTKKVQIDELSYKKEMERLSIYIKPKKGQFSPEDVTFRSSNFPFDLLVLIGVDSLERLEEIYNQNAELFFETPMLNIDFRASNENFAQFNLVNLSATSNSEIVYDLINQVEASFMDESMATQLLTGIITETDSFQHVRTTPQTFLKASQLVGLGANQQEIISRLYKSKSLGLLKLWGRVLARLKHISDITLVYSSISKNDMAAAEATEADSNQIIKEMVSQLGFAKLFLLSKETETNRTAVYFHTTLPLNTASLFSKFIPKPISFQTWRLSLELPVAEAERQIIQILTEEMGKYKVGA